MIFRLLGPLEVEVARGPIDLGGTRQRAALAFLLLHANRVVPTSRLVEALWPTDQPPTTARKILQNAVWRLRRALAHLPDSGGTPELVTRAPGYMVRVRGEQVDLLVFQQQVDRGRAALAVGDPFTAGRVLSDALSLWRGPVLADLVEDGMAWPELTAIQERRLDVMEDRFEAELASGGHHAILRELEAFVQDEPLRERAAQQLMLALYRCGRQADALGVYRRVRTALVDGLGLEPGREMQLLRQSILTHDPALDLLAEVTAQRETATVTGGSGTMVIGGEDPPTATWERAAAAPPDVPELTLAVAAEDSRAGRRPASVLLLRFSLGAEFVETLPADDVDRVLEAVSTMACETVERYGGLATTSIGSVQLSLFEPRPGEPDSAERAVLAATAVRDRLSAPADPLAASAPVAAGLAVHAAVTTGEAVICRWPVSGTVRPWVGGDVVDTCRTLLDRTPLGEVHVCDETRRLTARGHTYQRVSASPSAWREGTVGGGVENPGGWSAGAMAILDGEAENPGGWNADAIGTPDGECELDLMHGVWRRTRQRSIPHVITVLGEHLLGKTRLLREFRRALATESTDVRVLSCDLPPDPGGADARSTAAGVFAAYCGITGQDTADAAFAKARATIMRVAESEEVAETMLSLLRPLIAAEPPLHGGPGLRAALSAWRSFLGRAALEQPLVLIWDDVHRADDLLLETVEHLIEGCHGVPLLNVVGAHTALLERRPDWAGGRSHAMTISLTQAAAGPREELLRSLPPGGNADIV